MQAAQDARMSQQNSRILDQFAKQAERYADLVAAQPNDKTLPWLIDALRPLPTDRVLDVGCGSGNAAVTLAPLVAHVAGVDLTPAMLAKARELQAKSGVTNISWMEADVSALPFEDGAFEIVTSRAMLHHVADPAKVVAEMKRVCAPGGRILVMDLTPAAEKAAAFNAIELLRDPSHARAMPADELREMGASLGFSEIAFQQYETRLPIELVLATSFPGPGMVERVRALYRDDAMQGGDALGFGARLHDGVVTVAYPMTMAAWRRI